MKPEYLYELADMVDPDQLWRLRGMDQIDLPDEKRKQLDAGVALRRHAHHVGELQKALEQQKSLLITPLSRNSSTRKVVESPPEHKRLRDRQL